MYECLMDAYQIELNWMNAVWDGSHQSDASLCSFDIWFRSTWNANGMLVQNTRHEPINLVLNWLSHQVSKKPKEENRLVRLRCSRWRGSSGRWQKCHYIHWGHREPAAVVIQFAENTLQHFLRTGNPRQCWKLCAVTWGIFIIVVNFAPCRTLLNMKLLTAFV